MRENKPFLLYIRNFIFGAEDSLVSTVGLLAGVASAQVDKTNIVVAGVVLIFVEAFSMAAGSFLSQQAVEESQAKADVPVRRPLRGGVIMFFSYFASGFVPLFPYLVWEVQTAFILSIVLSLVALFVLGYISARILKISAVRSGFRMLVIGGLAVGLGILVGIILK